MTGDVEPDLKLEIAHILTIDVVAYSTLLMDEQSRLMKALNRAVRETASFHKAESERRLLRLPTGDGMVLVFQSDAEAPLECAKQIATALKEHPEIQLRMGIHSGPINTIRDVNDRPNLAGAGIDVAQRVMDCGDAGHILLSKRVADDLAPHPRWNRYLHDLGECVVKHGRKVSLYNFYSESFGNANTPQKLKSAIPLKSQRNRSLRRYLLLSASVLALCLATFFLTRSPPPGASIGVLPFVDMSSAHDQEYFCDGISEQITSLLGEIHGLFVAARTSAFVFKNRAVDVREIARKLGVRNVLEGSVSRSQGKVRVTAQLIDASNGFHVWAKTYDLTEEDVLSLQSDVAQQVADALQIELHQAEAERLEKPPTSDAKAYDLYLRGRYLVNKRTSESISRARELFSEAVARDPQFALGHSAIAYAYILLGEYGDISSTEASALARPEVSLALAIDDRLSDAYASKAMLLAHFDWNWPAAEAEYRRAIELNPNSASARHWYALHLAELGSFDKAIEQIDLAQRQDPLAPIIRAAKGKILFMAGRLGEAAEECRQALELEPSFLPALEVMGQIQTSEGKFSEALETMIKCAQMYHENASLDVAYVYAAAGQKERAAEIVERASLVPGNVSAYDLAIISAAEKDETAALRWLDTAIAKRSLSVVWMRVDPRLDNVRGNHRFHELVARLSPVASK